MAESSADNDGPGGSWWGSWLQTAKEKSAGALEFVKKDLAEFTTTMQRDTTSAVQVTSSTLQDTFKPENTEAAKDKMKESINGFFDGITKVLTIPPEDKDVSKPKSRDIGTGGGIYDRSKVRLHAVQVDPNTYLREPSGPPEYFEKWLETFNLDTKKGDISELLVVKVEVRALYTQLVPSELSHSEFWQRYFYKLYQLEQDEARKQALMKRAETPTEIDTLGWEDDWSGDESEEFENLTASEVKSVQQEDVQSRLAPEHQSAGSSKDSKTEKQVVIESSNNSPRPTESTIDGDSNISSDLTGTKNDQSKSDETNTLPPVTNCDSMDKGSNGDSKDLSEDVSTKEKTEISLDSQTTNCPEPKLPQPSKESDSKMPEIIKEINPKVTPTTKETDPKMSPSKETDPKMSPSKETDTKMSPSKEIDPKMPLSSKENDLLAAAKSKDAVDLVTPVESVPIEPIGSELKVEVGKGDNSNCECVEAEKDIKTKVKGDLVMVGSDRESPTSDSSGYKDFLRLIPEPSVDDDWEHDFDVELTEEQKKAYEQMNKKMGENLDSQDDDWESWE